MSKKLYIETYGCQMNISDSEVVASILENSGFQMTDVIEDASLILLNTCSIRENAENKVLQRINVIKKLRKENNSLKIGVIGCMAKRLKQELLTRNIAVDLVAGPDSYKELPQLIENSESNTGDMIHVRLSKSETYSDITPLRYNNNKLSTFVSIMRGCNNFCSYCIVPYTRGRERSKSIDSIISEVNNLSMQSFKEITLLGQNVNSYYYINGNEIIRFHNLIEKIAGIDPSIRIRYATSHPKDISDELLQTMATYDNVCKWIHLPVQSGSTSVLQRMKREYSREWYINRIEAIREYLPEATITSDILSGFCGETEEEHQDTLSLMSWVKFDQSYMFKYSERPGTYAAKHIKDDVPEETKTRRLNEIIQLQNSLSRESNEKDLGKTFEVLVEGKSKKSENEHNGRNSQNKMVVFPKENSQIGDYVNVKITKSSSATLKGVIV